MVKGILLNPNTGEHRCPECGGEWVADLKTDGGGQYKYGQQQCPHCKEKEQIEKHR